ncbi:hypothetical protein EVAR_41783_1 [Eumeta japonica]|uniref:Uncharacterized protein n=1 Tax=Eumeta variegata TaxID=151549 RepID=A0A4C1VXD2_EUMVA|nr:hypothetical protein EVAR_41783_1 [Eumeta japonica]
MIGSVAAYEPRKLKNGANDTGTVFVDSKLIRASRTNSNKANAINILPVSEQRGGSPEIRIPFEFERDEADLSRGEPTDQLFKTPGVFDRYLITNAAETLTIRAVTPYGPEPI